MAESCGGCVLGIDDINYSSLEQSSNYMVQSLRTLKHDNIPSFSRLGILRQPRVFDSGSFLLHLMELLNPTQYNNTPPPIEFAHYIMCPDHLYPFITHTDEGV
jgi:hypothetical protein